jgi:hypothetical protein
MAALLMIMMNDNFVPQYDFPRLLNNHLCVIAESVAAPSAQIAKEVTCKAE